MNLQQESPDSPNDSTAIQNGDKEESCVLIEENISTIEIDDTIQDPTNASAIDLLNESGELIEDEILSSEFQVIDEVGGSQEVEENGEVQDQNEEEGEHLNGVRLEMANNLVRVCNKSYFCRKQQSTSFARQTATARLSTSWM